MSASVPRLRIGSTEIIALTDGEGPFFSPRAEAFPEATAAQWAEADRYDPGAVDAEDRWRLQFRAYAIRGDEGLTVVDAGIGPADSPARGSSAGLTRAGAVHNPAPSAGFHLR
ncbi:hypothetical protein ADK82_00765 [Streptomyces sp. NRRL S-4]|nr:hypothetical protein ADK82_00765 [Streptomyces sp. NRRL S-4]